MESQLVKQLLFSECKDVAADEHTFISEEHMGRVNVMLLSQVVSCLCASSRIF